MDYEIFFWLEGVFGVLFGVGFLCAIVGLIGGIAFKVCSLDKNEPEITRRDFTIFGNKFLKVLVAGVVILCISNPLSDFSNIYKKILIYRGINSTLADKSIDTADKALDLLNLKLDEEMGKLKAELAEAQKELTCGDCGGPLMILDSGCPACFEAWEKKNGYC